MTTLKKPKGKRNSRLSHSELNKKRNQLAALSDAIQSLNISKDQSMHDLVISMARTIGKALGTHAIAIWKATEDRKHLKMFVNQGLAKEYEVYFNKHPYGVEKGSSAILAKAYTKRRPRFTPDIWADEGTLSSIPQVVKDLVKKEGYVSVASFPLIVQAQTYGVLNFYFSTPHAFTKNEQEILRIASNTISIAIGNNQYHHTLKKAQDTLREERDQLAKLQQTVEFLRISPQKSLQEVLDEMARTIGDAVGAHAIAIWKPSDDKKYLNIFLSRGLSTEYVTLFKENPMSLAPLSVVGRAAHEKRPVFEANLTKAAEILELTKSLLAHIYKEGIVSLASLPLLVNGDLFGVLNFYFATPHNFSPSERYVLGVAANTTAIAIENEQQREDLHYIQDALVKALKDSEVAREKAEEQRNRTQLILNNFSDGILVLNKHMKVQMINPRAQKMLNISEDDVTDKKLSEIAKITNFDSFLISNGKNANEASTKEASLSGDRTVDITAVPVFSQDKNKVGTLLVIHDITREKLVEKLKSEFVSLAAHQLRTPLSAIKWVFNLLMSGDFLRFSEEQKRLLKIGYDSNERMIMLINELLNVTRIEEGKYLYNPKDENINDLVESVVDSRQGMARRTKKNLEIITDKHIPLVRVDKEKFMIAVQNLIDNALTYTLDGGKILLSTSYDNKKSSVKLSISDNGIGIPETQKDRVFQRFFRATNAARINTTGTGLGLYVTKNIIEAHGGKIWFKSKENRGTVFFIEIPTKTKKINDAKRLEN